MCPFLVIEFMEMRRGSEVLIAWAHGCAYRKHIMLSGQSVASQVSETA
jgi:hypothetical protein